MSFRTARLRWDSIGRIARIDWDPAGSSQLLADYGHFGGQTAWRSLPPKDASADTRIETIYRFDTLGRLDRITDSRTGTTPAAIDDYEFVYDDFGNLVEERYNRFDGNSATTNAGDGFTYDRFHRLQEAVLGSNTLPPSQNPGTFLSALTYDLDHAGNRETLTTTPGSGTPSTETYTSAANRYTQVQPTIPTTLLYDGRGNLILDGTRYYVYDFKDRLSEIWLLVADEVPAETTALVAADALEEQEAQAPLGSVAPLQAARETILAAMTAPPSSGEEVARMQFYGALTEPVTLPYGTPIQTQSGVQYAQQSSTTTSLQLVALYGYDTGNRRVARVAVAQAATWLHVYDGWREIQELSVDASTGVKRIAKEFVWGSRLDELVAYRRNDAAVGQAPSWTTYHTTQCGHECILSVIDSTGQLAERAMYDPYGRVTVYAPDETLIGNAFQSGLPMSWKAHRVETEAPLVYMRNRHYSPGLGRFLSVDRIGVFTDAFNLGSGYAYGASNPILFVDPFGLQGSSYRLSVSTSDGISFWHEASAGSEGEFHISSPDGALFDARIKVPDESGTPDESGEPRRPVDIAPPITNDDSWWDYLKSVAWTAAGVAGGIAVNYCIDEMTGVGGGIYRAVSSLLAGDVWGALGELVSAVTPVPSLKFTEDSLESIRRAARGAPEHHLMTNKNRISTARGGPWTPRFEDMANRAGMTLDDAANRVRIPGHVGPHSEEYHAEVFNRLSRSTEGLSGDAYSQAFRAELEAIRTEAATPGSALNRPIVR